ncbi:hypothetical protein [Viridibacillus arvi]|uniref:hypothetical protein n=1 Tax=Viridibacillus arvi TaxID=263475 RepID=UPI0034CD404E
MSKFETVTYEIGEKPILSTDDVLKKSIIAEVFYLDGNERAFAGEIVGIEQFGMFSHISVYGREGRDSFSIGGTDETIEEGVATIKGRYVDHLELTQKFNEDYDNSELVKEFNVSREAYIDNVNIKSEVNNIKLYRAELDSLKPVHAELLEFFETDQFNTLPQIAKEILIDQGAKKHKEISKIEKDLNKCIDHLAGYNDMVQKRLDGIK